MQYVTHTCSALQAAGADVRLLIPGPKPDGLDPHSLQFAVEWVDVGYPSSGDPSRAQRYRFCQEANRIVQRSAANGEYDVCHVLFGLFAIEEIETSALGAHGVAGVATVHNVPPMECGRTWPGDSLQRRIAEPFRLAAVGIKNRSRLRRNAYACYVVPSRRVADALARCVPGGRTSVIAHGLSEDLIALVTPRYRRPRPGERVRILTVGGWVPHKRQHIIPDAAARLWSTGIAFQWDIAGPAGRLNGYRCAVEASIDASNLRQVVKTHDALGLPALARLYEDADLYVQPSTEEGFCIAALDAAAAGLPVIGSPAGAIPEICEASGGEVVASDPAALAHAISGFIRTRAWTTDATGAAHRVREKFNWAQSATELLDCYDRTLGRIGKSKTRTRHDVPTGRRVSS